MKRLAMTPTSWCIGICDEAANAEQTRLRSSITYTWVDVETLASLARRPSMARERLGQQATGNAAVNILTGWTATTSEWRRSADTLMAYAMTYM